MAYVLIITQLPLLKAGNQILAQTIAGWVKNGYQVIVLTSAPKLYENAVAPAEVFHERAEHVVIHHFTPPLRRLRSFTRTIRFARPLVGTGAPPVPNALRWKDVAVDDVIPFEKTSLFGAAVSLVYWLSFRVGAASATARLVDHLGKPALIYGYEVFGAPAARQAGKHYGVPYVTKYQGTTMPVGASPRTKLLNIIHYLGLKTPAPLVFMENDGTRGNRVLQELGHPEQAVRFWVDGVRKDLYSPLRKREALGRIAGVEPEDTVLVTVSRLTDWKRIDRAVWLMTQLSDLARVKLLVVGEGPEGPAWRALAKWLGVEDAVLFLGGVAHDKIADILSDCDIFLSLYDHSNLCNPVLEALECGSCIVSLADGSTEGILEDGTNARLVPLGQLHALLPAVVRGLITDPHERARLGAGARRYAETHLKSWDQRMAMEVAHCAALMDDYFATASNKGKAVK